MEIFSQEDINSIKAKIDIQTCEIDFLKKEVCLIV
jgi:hypothetical protein